MKIPNFVKSFLVKKGGLSARTVQDGSEKVQSFVNTKLNELNKPEEQTDKQDKSDNISYN